MGAAKRRSDFAKGLRPGCSKFKKKFPPFLKQKKYYHAYLNFFICKSFQLSIRLKPPKPPGGGLKTLSIEISWSLSPPPGGLGGLQRVENWNLSQWFKLKIERIFFSKTVYFEHPGLRPFISLKPPYK